MARARVYTGGLDGGRGLRVQMGPQTQNLSERKYHGNKLTFHVEASGSRFLQLTQGSDRKSVVR